MALAIDEDAQAVRAHRANHPQVPVVQARITHIDQFKAIVRAYLPEEHWGKAWFHSSNSCKPAATVNRRRDLAAAIEDTEFFISCMQSCEPAIWTLENSQAMFRHFEGQSLIFQSEMPPSRRAAERAEMSPRRIEKARSRRRKRFTWPQMAFLKAQTPYFPTPYRTRTCARSTGDATVKKQSDEH